jgi:2-methylisocitrate lyase-like PEP mutase family enzyme
MSSKFKTFRDLHQSPNLFVLPNVWNPKSAIFYQERKIPAIATSSAAVAGSLGYKDGEEMPFSNYQFIIDRILSCVDIPLSVDVEMGYGTTDENIYMNILDLVEMGVIGINIEDSTINSSGRVLKDAKTFANTIEGIKNKLASGNVDLFCNIRCDTYLLDVKNKQQETRLRVKNYEEAGADGIFIPCISAEDDISETVGYTKLPLNVMCVPGLPGFERLNQLGVKRVSMGPFLFNKVYGTMNPLFEEIIKAKSFSTLLF